MKINIYLLVFGIIGALIVIAALSTLVFNKPNPSISSGNVSLAGLPNLGKAPNFQAIDSWINSPPLNITSLRGKVILVDFWTYSCINCIRTIPYLNAWESKYGSNGLVIVGVSTPEFQFEKSYSNVKSAVQRFGIRYPVALDNNYSTWDAYGNRFWPEDYLIDKNGSIRYMHIGEGNYNTTEHIIQLLLENAGYTINTSVANVSGGVNFSQIGTPELYLGYNTARQQIGNSQGFSPGSVVNYSTAGLFKNNTAYFVGRWYNAPDSMIAVNNSRLFLVYKAKDLNVVASGNGNSSTVTVKLDGNSLTQSDIGSDVHIVDNQAMATVNASRLYNLVAAQSYGWHTIEIDASPGFRVYTFTFG